MTRPTVVCLTPVKNEEWILQRFLEAVSLWADHILLLDQQSDDRTREIAGGFPKARILENPSTVYNEDERQKMLIRAAREIPGPKLLIALDADEFVTANFLESAEWQRMLQADPGTVIYFEWACMLHDLESYYIFPAEFPLGFMDDGSEHKGRKIHSPRLPVPKGASELHMRDVKVFHFSTADFGRFRSKIRSYMCWEFVNQPEKWSFSWLYRSHHRDFWVPPEKVHSIPPAWLESYERNGIDIRDIPRYQYYRWDRELLELFQKYGTKKFRRLAVWDMDWNLAYRDIYSQPVRVSLSDPRSPLDRAVHRWLWKTQPFYSHFPPQPTIAQRIALRVFNKLLDLLGWDRSLSHSN